MSFLKSDLFVQFRVFYIKEFTRQKKVTNKLFISVRCVVIAKRGGGVRSARWNSVGCVMMWYSGANCSPKSQINTDVPTVQNFHLKTCTEKSHLTEPICVDQFILLSFLWSMLWNAGNVKLLILKRLHKSEQRINVIFEE